MFLEMKKYLIILFTISSFAISKAQTNLEYLKLEKFNTDTLEYLRQNFIQNKQKYIGKEFNYLLKDLEIPIKSYRPDISDLKYIYIPKTSFLSYSFIEAGMRKDPRIKYWNVTIEWSHPLLFDSIMRLAYKSKYAWAEDDRKYFGRQIIGNIDLTQW